jgi:hypothetical protein
MSSRRRSRSLGALRNSFGLQCGMTPVRGVCRPPPVSLLTGTELSKAMWCAVTSMTVLFVLHFLYSPQTTSRTGKTPATWFASTFLGSRCLVPLAPFYSGLILVRIQLAPSQAQLTEWCLGIATTTIAHQSWIDYMNHPSKGLTGSVVAIYVSPSVFLLYHNADFKRRLPAKRLAPCFKPLSVTSWVVFASCNSCVSS